jgi:hypothetical protein
MGGSLFGWVVLYLDGWFFIWMGGALFETSAHQRP